jgi:cytoskeleton protein RodZ
VSESGTGEAIGRQLREARERMGLGVAEAAQHLHVDEKVIDALETGRFKALGAPVYVRGHLKHYAELVGEPSASGLYESLHESPPDIAAGLRAPDVTLPPRRRWPLVLFALLLVLAVAAWWATGVQSN